MKRYLLNRQLLIVMTCAVISMAVTLPASAAWIDTTLNEAISVADPDAALPVIIRLTGISHSASHHASSIAAGRLAEQLQLNAAASQGLVRALLKSKGITGIVSLWIINGLAVALTPEQILEMAEHPDVESIALDAVVEAPAAPDASSQVIIGDAWDNLGAINAPSLWGAGIIGSGVVVATMDTGADSNHPDLIDSWRGGSNSWYDPNGQHASPYDANGHGTQVLGIIVGGDAGGRPVGVAPGASWIAAKIFDDNGNASYSGIHLGFQWLLDPDGQPDTADAPHVVNNSWGLSNAVGQCVVEFQEDVQLLRSAGIAVVFSGGNYGPADATSASPANYPESFAVGAVDADLIAAADGSRGPSACDGGYFPDVSAPGVGIFTTDRTFGGVFPDSYTLASGSSFAAPHTAGAMALLKSAYPGATVEDLQNALTDSAVDRGTTGVDDIYGFGLIDVAAAAGRLSNPPGCLDEDNDGFFSGAGCGTLVDCDDANPAINPSAVEIQNDGIDQNCNGYDLTIVIASAVYLTSDDKLDVTAASAYGANAELALAGYGPMKYDRKKDRWTISVRSAGGNPGAVTVSGIEGSVTGSVTVDSGSTGGGGGGGKGKPKK